MALVWVVFCAPLDDVEPLKGQLEFCIFKVRHHVKDLVLSNYHLFLNNHTLFIGISMLLFCLGSYDIIQ